MTETADRRQAEHTEHTVRLIEHMEPMLRCGGCSKCWPPNRESIRLEGKRLIVARPSAARSAEATAAAQKENDGLESFPGVFVHDWVERSKLIEKGFQFSDAPRGGGADDKKKDVRSFDIDWRAHDWKALVCPQVEVYVHVCGLRRMYNLAAGNYDAKTLEMKNGLKPLAEISLGGFGIAALLDQVRANQLVLCWRGAAARRPLEPLVLVPGVGWKSGNNENFDLHLNVLARSSTCPLIQLADLQSDAWFVKLLQSELDSPAPTLCKMCLLLRCVWWDCFPPACRVRRLLLVATAILTGQTPFAALVLYSNLPQIRTRGVGTQATNILKGGAASITRPHSYS